MAGKTPRSEWWGDAQVGRDGFCRTIFAPAPMARFEYGQYDDFAPGFITSTTTYPGFTVTEEGNGGTLVMADEVGGVLQLTADGTAENDGIQMQTHEFILPAADKHIWFECKVKGNDVIQTDWFIGLCTTDTTIITGNPADIIGFHSHDEDVNIDFEVSATAGAGTPVDTTSDLTDDTWVRLGFWVNGLTSVVPYIDGVANATATSTTVANIPAVELGLAFACLTGEAAANTLEIDWYRIVQLR